MSSHCNLYEKKNTKQTQISPKLQCSVINCKWHMSSITLNTVAMCCLCIPCLIASVCAQTTDHKQ